MKRCEIWPARWSGYERLRVVLSSCFFFVADRGGFPYLYRRVLWKKSSEKRWIAWMYVSFRDHPPPTPPPPPSRCLTLLKNACCDCCANRRMVSMRKLIGKWTRSFRKSQRTSYHLPVQPQRRLPQRKHRLKLPRRLLPPKKRWRKTKDPPPMNCFADCRRCNGMEWTGLSVFTSFPLLFVTRRSTVISRA